MFDASASSLACKTRYLRFRCSRSSIYAALRFSRTRLSSQAEGVANEHHGTTINTQIKTYYGMTGSQMEERGTPASEGEPERVFRARAGSSHHNISRCETAAASENE